MLTLLAKLINALNSDSSPRQIAAGISLGLIIGLTPLFSLHNLLVLIIAFLIRINLGGFFLAITFFAGFSYFINPLAILLGESLLTSSSLEAMWHALYQLSALKLAHYHHTLTLGSLLISLVLFLPVMWLSQFLIIRYRVHIKAFIEKFKIVRAIKASKFYSIYQSVAGA